MFVSATRRQRRVNLLVLALLLGFAAGCDFLNRPGPSEETDPHYLDGMTAKKLYDWDAAIAHFENALHANPNSGAAHRELGFLFDEKRTNFIRALYHYERFKELHVTDTNRLVADRVFYCRVKLASEYATYLDRMQNQTEIDRWRAAVGQRDQEIARREQEIANLRSWITQISRLTNQVIASSSGLMITAVTGPEVSNSPLVLPARNQLTPATSPPGGTNSSAAPRSPESTPQGASTPLKPAPIAERLRKQGFPPKSTPPVASKRQHTIRSGDTLVRIAKQYGVSLSRLQAANPHLDPRQLKVGKLVVIPDSY
ncbi:MAG: LysM peptidoglycan-binding domain-containing protein [Pedosphaera sp.]|nr:LysM peptidoglycan-binding domain-containing protein [Pedosphaera sp.]